MSPFANIPIALPDVKSGRLRTLGVTSLMRSSVARSIQPIAETACRATRRRLRFIAALDRDTDPRRDSKNVPVKGASPPLTGGIVYSSGEFDSSKIPDPAVRAEYGRALKASEDYEKRYDVQFQLRRIEERAMRFVERLLAERYTDSPADRGRFEYKYAGLVGGRGKFA